MIAIRYVLIFIRLMLGAWMLLNGLNHFVNVFPQPLGHTQLAGELMVTLIDTGLFGLVKITEIAVGIMLLFDWFVPLALVMSLPISTVILYNRAVLDERGLDFSMGNGCFFFTLVLMVAYVPYYLPMLSWHTEMGRLADLRRLSEIVTRRVDVAPESSKRLLIAIAGIVVTLVVFYRIHPRSELPPGLGKTPAVVVGEFLDMAYAQGKRAQAEKLYLSADAIANSANIRYPVDGQAVEDTIVNIVAQGHKVAAYHHIRDPQQPEPIYLVEFYRTDRSGTLIERNVVTAGTSP